MVKFIYLLCALASLWCAFLLLGTYARNKYRILLWSGLCFAGLSINNILLVLDRLVLPEVDLSTWRLASALVALCLLIYGLLWENE